MTDKRKKKVDAAKAVELEEERLEEVKGGGTYDFAFKTMDVIKPSTSVKKKTFNLKG